MSEQNTETQIIDEFHGKGGAYVIVDGKRVLDTDAVSTKVGSDVAARAPYDAATTDVTPAPPEKVIDVPAAPTTEASVSTVEEPAPVEPARRSKSKE